MRRLPILSSFGPVLRGGLLGLEQVGRRVRAEPRQEDGLGSRAEKDAALLIVVLGLVPLRDVDPDLARPDHVAGPQDRDFPGRIPVRRWSSIIAQT